MATVHPLPVYPLPVHPLPVYPLPVHPLPNEHSIIKKYAYDEITEYVEEHTTHLYRSMCNICGNHRGKLILFFILIAIGGIIIFVVKKNTTNVFPCVSYGADTLARDVSVACLQYLWSQNKCRYAIDSSPTWMWWLQSPQGLTTVKCNHINTGINCGAGSYSTILTYTQLCNPSYRG